MVRGGRKPRFWDSSKINEEYNVFIISDYCTNENTLGGIHQWPSALDYAEFRSRMSDTHQVYTCSCSSTSWIDPCLTPAMNSTQPQTPPRPCIDLVRSKGTPRHHKTPRRKRKPGIKPLHQSIKELQEELRRLLTLSFTPEEWQAHIIQWVKQGYNSIFLAGTGYGKSLVFRVRHGYGNTHGFRAAGYAATGTV
jgi:hypothetical protein